MAKLYCFAPVKAAVLILLVSFLSGSKIEAQTYPTQTPITANIDYAIKGYYEWLPADYNTSTSSYPVIIFLHGIGECGDGSQAQLPRVLANGPPKLINNKTFPTSVTVNGKTFSFIVISPQFNSNARTYTVVDTLVQYVVKKYRVDKSRIYLTGLSMGGGITWIYAGSKATYANTLAALVPVCANTDAYPANAKIIAAASLPVKMFHNSGDPTVSVTFSQDWYNMLNADGINPAAQLTIFNANSHDAWSKAYDPTYTENGMNIYQWMLQYSRGTSTSGSSSTNVAPTANAGSDQTVVFPATATLNGTGSKDSDGSISAYAWSQVSGPSTATLATATASTTTASGLVAGTYVFQLKVTDNSGATATDTVTITVTATAPSVVAGSTDTLTLPTSTATLDGSKSTAGSGASITAYKWAYVSGPSSYAITSATSVTTTATGLTAGTYVFQLTVTNNAGLSSTGNKTVVVKAAAAASSTGNKAPTVVLVGATSTITLPLSSFWLDASGSTDADGSIASYKWTYVSGPSSYYIITPTASRTIVNKLVAGTYKFLVTVTDNLGATSTATVTLTVNAAATSAATSGSTTTVTNQAPVATVVGATSTITLPLSSFWLDASGSTDADGTIASYKWSYVSGPSSYYIITSTDARTIVNKLVAGTYKFLVTVTDNEGATGTATVTLTVNAAATAAVAMVATTTADTLSTSSSSVVTGFQIYPNPARDVLNVKWGSGMSGKAQVDVIDISGVRRQTAMYENVSEGAIQQVQLSALPVGVYFVRIVSGGKMTTLRFVKQ